MNLVEHIKNVIIFRGKKSFDMSYGECCKKGIFDSINSDIAFEDKSLNRFAREKNEHFTSKIFDEYSISTNDRTPKSGYHSNIDDRKPSLEEMQELDRKLDKILISVNKENKRVKVKSKVKNMFNSKKY